MWIPGFGSEEIRPYKKACTTEAHKQVRSPHKHQADTGMVVMASWHCEFVASFKWFRLEMTLLEPPDLFVQRIEVAVSPQLWWFCPKRSSSSWC